MSVPQRVRRTRPPVIRTVYIGIDPGVSGGIAALDQGGAVVLCEKMPEDGAVIYRKLRELKRGADRCYAVIENVRAFAMPGRRMGATSAFTFGWNACACNLSLEIAGIATDRIEPRAWQMYLGLELPKGQTNEAGRARKAMLKDAAESYFPDRSVIHATADALLIALYCRRKVGGES